MTALHAADIGISVENAVPVAKDAANIILLEEFSVLKDGIEEEGRRFKTRSSIFACGFLRISGTCFR